LTEVEPLRASTADGRPFTRRTTVEQSIRELQALPRDELLKRCSLAPGAASYVPSEALLHFIRAARNDESEAWFERLYKLFYKRVQARLPRVKADGATSLTEERIRDQVLNRLHLLMVMDRQGYCEKLDWFEINFDSALAKMRIDARRPAWREEQRRTGLEDEETGDVRSDVERAKGSFDPFDVHKLDDPRYLSRLLRAINDLPVEQREIIEMLRQGFPIQSKEAGVVDIAGTLNVVEKTVRNRRDRAFTALRTALGED
jgi:hypothetical protein